MHSLTVEYLQGGTLAFERKNTRDVLWEDSPSERMMTSMRSPGTHG